MAGTARQWWPRATTVGASSLGLRARWARVLGKNVAQTAQGVGPLRTCAGERTHATKHCTHA
eukprot:11201382-Lingulodinium_polyedra.AAC.1